MKEIKIILKLMIRCILRFVCFIPIKKNRVFFESFGGKQFSCNPYYIYKYLSEHYCNLEFVWATRNNHYFDSTAAIKFVNYNSLSYVYYRMTSNVIICNESIQIYIPYRKAQLLINTWHGGGAYKKCGVLENGYKSFLFGKIERYLQNKAVSYFISSSKKFTEIMSSSNLIPIEKYLSIGMPRNDVFFNSSEYKKINLEVRKLLNITDTTFVILYAPTFRGNAGDPMFNLSLDIEAIKQACKNRFNKEIIIIFRGHHTFTKHYSESYFDMDLSDYNNMQELLCMSDMLITDYSSTMWDFSFTYKPCFLVVPDLDDYIEQRGFYTNPESWGFPLAKTNNELLKLISYFDINDFQSSIKKHHKDLQSYENGHATETVCKIIMKKIDS